MFIVVSHPNSRDSNRFSIVVWLLTADAIQALQVARAIPNDRRESHYISSVVIYEIEPDESYIPDDFWSPVDEPPKPKQVRAYIGTWQGEGLWGEKFSERFAALVGEKPGRSTTNLITMTPA